MSDPLHLDKVRAGAAVWNKWRRDNAGVVPDLNCLRISAGELQFGAVQGGPIDFSRAELAQAVLVHATLIEANLAGAVLVKADLSYSRLNGANLRGADLRGAKFAYADLTDARLDGAFVCGADLRHARGLTQMQIDRAFGGEDTLLPADLDVPATWLAEDERERQRGDGQGIDSLIKAYDLLGVKPKASMQQIRTAWLRLVKELHPDISADDPSANERLKAINRAYQGLKSLEQREIARRSQRRTSSGAATFAVCLLLPIAATFGVAVWTHGIPALRDATVAAVTEPREAPAEPSTKVALAPSQDGDEARTSAALRYLPRPQDASGEVTALPTSRPDNASDDDAAWAQAAAEASTASLHRYLGRFPQGRHAQKAIDDLTQLAAVELALGKDDGARDAAAMQRAEPILRHYLVEYPTGQLADEARARLAALEAGARADVAWSGAAQKDAAQKDDDKQVPDADASKPRTLASAEATGREGAEAVIAWSDAQNSNASESDESMAAYLQTRRNGHTTDIARALIGDPVEAAKPVTAGHRQGTRPVRPSASIAHSGTRWPSADEPFVAADGRIR